MTASRALRLRRNAGVTAQSNGCNAVSAGAVETGDRIANETADSLGSAVLVGACGVFVAVLRNHAKIVRANANRESPQPAARSRCALIRSAMSPWPSPSVASMVA